MSRFANRIFCSVAVLALLSPAGLAQARPAEPEEAQATMNTVVVTARKRDELIGDVPTAISAFGSEEIARLNLVSIDDLASFTPGLQTAESSVSSGGSIALRGVGSGSSNYLGDQAVSINVDGMQIGTLNIRKAAQIDLEQIEILRGPQALFFGKNSPGGVISMKTADPTPDRLLALETGYEAVSQDAYYQALYSAPVSDTVGVRLVARYSDLNGYFKVKSVPANGDPLVTPAPVSRWPSGEEFFARATVVVDATEALRLKGKLTFNESKIEGGSIMAQQRIACPLGAPQLQPDFPCKADRDIYVGNGRPEDVALAAGAPSRNGIGFRNNQQILGTLQADYKVSPDLTLTSVTGYYLFDEVNAHDASIGPRAVLLVPYLPFEMRQFSQEVRLASDWDAPVNFTTGVFYETRDTYGAQDAVITAFPPAPFAIGQEQTFQDQEAFSAFAQLIWDVTDRLEVSGGLRYSEEDKSLRFFRRGVDVTGNLVRDSLSFDNVSPELTVSYDVTDDIMVFGSYKEGFKSGGFDGGFTNGAIAAGNFANTFDEETVTGFEGGVKATLFDQLVVNLTAYEYDYDDLQVGAFDPDSISFKVLNAAAAKVRGIEADFNWQTPAEGLFLRGSLALNDAKFEDFLSGCYLGQTVVLGCNINLNPVTGAFLQQDLSGRQMNNAPDTAATGGILYSGQLGNGLGFDLAFDATYSSDYYANLRQSPLDLQKAYTKLNASLRLFGDDDRWEVSLLGRNLTDEYTFNASAPITLTGGGSGIATAISGDQSAVVSRGREVFLKFTWRPVR
ncbi:putative TonB dependent receptor [Hyphomonas neptunium ATCC 15444]|uniref:Putative TonB dependent receptor n=2 Tax=Hyphomonas TaxID=85 RepID=Q0C263_HYPNA|nr:MULTISPECIES: TonB-dependent receptor [Hyphomonas]ABI77235.1 putative TonB dependent receptor [Hyphomonas neptunium ATCC 15444]KCZ93108.1 putative TonB dependent receptor [Hyphomonas hirschiana VP5]